MVRRNIAYVVIGEQEKGCPFCGSRDVKVDFVDGITYYLCDGCGAVVSFRGNEGKDDAAKCWGKREIRNLKSEI